MRSKRSVREKRHKLAIFEADVERATFRCPEKARRALRGCSHRYSFMRPVSWAITTAWARSRALSLASIRLMWVLTVLSEMQSSSASCSFDSPLKVGGVRRTFSTSFRGVRKRQFSDLGHVHAG